MSTLRPDQRMTIGRSGTPAYVVRRRRLATIVGLLSIIVAKLVIQGFALLVRSQAQHAVEEIESGRNAVASVPVMSLGRFVIIMAALMIVAGIGIIVFTLWSDWKLRRRVIAVNCELCPSCAYPLSQLPAEHVCPECGLRYQLEPVQQVWRLWVDSWKFKWY